MEKTCRKKTDRLFAVWLVVCAATMVWFAVYGAQFTYFSEAKLFCIVVYGLLDLLFLLASVTGRAYWISGSLDAETGDGGAKAGKRYAVVQLLLFLCASALYLVYCFREQFWFRGPDSVRDSMAAAGILCAACAVSMKCKVS